MKSYKLKIKGKSYEVNVNDLIDNSVKVEVNGVTYDVEIEVKVRDENPGKKTTQANSKKIGEDVYYSIYTTQIENTLKTINICKNYILEKMPKDTKKLKNVKEVEEFMKLRIGFMNRWNFKSSLKLLKYISLYPRYRSYLADFKECFKNTISSD